MSTPTIDYDALAAQHGGSAQIDYDALAAQHGGTASEAHTDSRNWIQRQVDNLTTVTPEQEAAVRNISAVHPQIGEALNQAQKFGAGAIQGFTAPIVHPMQTIEGIGHAIAHPIDTGKTFAQSTIDNPAQAAGALVGGVALSDAAPLGLKTAGAAVPERIASAGADIGKAAASRFLPALVDGPPESLLTRAIKPGKNNINWNSDVRSAIPLMKSAEETLGRPIAGIDDALEAAKAAKQSIWQQYQQRLGPNMQAAFDGNQIADAMMRSIDRRTAIQNPGLVAKVQQIADTYRRPLGLGEAEDFLQSANKDLNSYYAKNKVGQNVALNDPEIASTVAEAEALRKGLYSKLDQMTGPGAAQLKQAYGSLSNVQKELYGRQLVAARQNPESLSEQLSTARGVGHIARSVANLNMGDAIEGGANMAAAKLLKERNTPDAMIMRAFQAAKPAKPFPMPSIRMPMTTNLLPAESGAKIPLMAPDPGMSGGERIAALMQLLRQNPQPALPAKASPIILPPPS